MCSHTQDDKEPVLHLQEERFEGRIRFHYTSWELRALKIVTHSYKDLTGWSTILIEIDIVDNSDQHYTVNTLSSSTLKHKFYITV